MNNAKKLIELERKLYKYDGEDQILSSYTLIESLKHEEREKSIEIKSGLPTLDRLIHGFEGGELTIISGLTGNGKTLFAQTLTRNFANQNIKSLWFSYEVRIDNFLKSFGDDLPLFYMPGRLKENSIDWITLRIYEAKLKYEIEAVFVDHLHYLIDMSNKHHISMEIGTVMRSIKKLALRFNICFFLIAHTTKIRPEEELSLGDTRDSSFIEQEADNVFYIWRLLKKENRAVLKIAKNRRYGVFEKKIPLIKVKNFLQEMESDNDR